MSNFPSTTYWRNCLFSITYSCLLCHRLIDHYCMGLFLGFLSCSIHLCVCFYARTLLFWLLQLFSINQSTNESLIIEAARYSRKINEGEARKPGCSPQFSSVQSLSRVWLFVTPWITARQASVHHQLPEFTQTHVHRVSDAIQPSHPLSSPSPPAPKPSQHQSLFQWVNSSHEVAKVLEFQL